MGDAWLRKDREKRRGRWGGTEKERERQKIRTQMKTEKGRERTRIEKRVEKGIRDCGRGMAKKT